LVDLEKRSAEERLKNNDQQVTSLREGNIKTRAIGSVVLQATINAWLRSHEDFRNSEFSQDGGEVPVALAHCLSQETGFGRIQKNAIFQGFLTIRCPRIRNSPAFSQEFESLPSSPIYFLI
jgi:hypothetical protein